MEIFIELFQLTGELLVTLVNLGTSDLAVRAVGNSFKTDDAKKIFLFIFHLTLGTILGAGSLLLFPNPFIKNLSVRVLSLILSPILAAATFHMIGKRLISQNKRTTKIEHFSGAFELAFSFCLVRFLFAHA